jgi:hypothetical protein
MAQNIAQPDGAAPSLPDGARHRVAVGVDGSPSSRAALLAALTAAVRRGGVRGGAADD